MNTDVRNLFAPFLIDDLSRLSSTELAAALVELDARRDELRRDLENYHEGIKRIRENVDRFDRDRRRLAAALSLALDRTYDSEYSAGVV